VPAAHSAHDRSADEGARVDEDEDDDEDEYNDDDDDRELDDGDNEEDKSDDVLSDVWGSGWWLAVRCCWSRRCGDLGFDRSGGGEGLADRDNLEANVDGDWQVRI
jgi:hypothetical protein